MAMDSASKRFSMMTFSLKLGHPLPWASLITTKISRQTFLSEYGGNNLSAQATTPSTDPDPGMAFWGSRGGSVRRINV